MQDRVVADRDYLLLVSVFADSARSDTLESGTVRLRFDLRRDPRGLRLDRDVNSTVVRVR